MVFSPDFWTINQYWPSKNPKLLKQRTRDRRDLSSSTELTPHMEIITFTKDHGNLRGAPPKLRFPQEISLPYEKGLLTIGFPWFYVGFFVWHQAFETCKVQLQLLLTLTSVHPVGFQQKISMGHSFDSELPDVWFANFGVLYKNDPLKSDLFRGPPKKTMLSWWLRR